MPDTTEEPSTKKDKKEKEKDKDKDKKKDKKEKDKKKKKDKKRKAEEANEDGEDNNEPKFAKNAKKEEKKKKKEKESKGLAAASPAHTALSDDALDDIVAGYRLSLWNPPSQRSAGSSGGSQSGSQSVDGSRMQTNASLLSQVDFQNVFAHQQAENLAQFETILGVELEVYPRNLLAGEADLPFAVGDTATETELQQFMKKWFREDSKMGKIHNVLLGKPNEEAGLRTVLNAFSAIRRKPPITPDKVELMKDPRGSLVTRVSRKALVFFVPETSMLFFGQVRNGEACCVQDAIRQCAGYLFFMLWWFRVVHEKDVREVYGFAISGPKCQDVEENHVAVSLLILKLPEVGSAGDVLCPKFDLIEFTQHKEIGLAGNAVFKELSSFLALKSSDPFSAENIPTRFVCPGLMLMPTSLLDKNLDENEQQWNVIKNGTGSLVILCNDAESARALLAHSNETEMNLICKEIANLREPKTKLFVKFKSVVGGKQWSSLPLSNTQNNMMRRIEYVPADASEFVERWLFMHTVCSGELDRFSVVVTRKMGERFSIENIESYQEFKEEFRCLMTGVVAFQAFTGLIHCDIHKGNIVFDNEQPKGKKLFLIDWDESAIRSIVARTGVTDKEKAIYSKPTMSTDLFTKKQLLCLFAEYHEKYAELQKGDDAGQWPNWSNEFCWSAILNLDDTDISDMYDLLDKHLLVTGC